MSFTYRRENAAALSRCSSIRMSYWQKKPIYWNGVCPAAAVWPRRESTRSSIHPSIDVNCLVTHHKTHAAPSKEEGAASINWCEWVHPSISWWRIENITGERYSCPSDDEHFLYQEIIRSSFSLILGLSHIGQLDSSSRSFYPFFFSFTPNCKTLGWY
jgi:hypothetical protein